jgi:inner membrane protein
MDPFSHALLGAACGYGLTRTRSRIAALAGAAGALLPDADVLIGSGSDPLLNLEYHRHFTHSLMAAPFGAAIVAGILWLVLRRRTAFAQVYWPALAGYVSAILLDACTSYGTQLLWPFSDKRFAASIVAVIDPVVTLLLLVGVIAALRSAAPKPARFAVALTVVYLGFGWLQRERAEGVVERAAAERGHVISVHEVKPTLGNLLLWRSVYLTGKEYVVDAPRVGLFSAPVLYPGGSVRRVEPIDLVPPLTLNSVQAEDLVRFAKVSEGYLARYPGRPNVIGDVRYSILPNDTRPLWGIEIMPEREEQHVAFRTFRQFTKQDRERFFAMLRGVAPASLVESSPKRPKQESKGRQGRSRDAM